MFTFLSLYNIAGGPVTKFIVYFQGTMQKKFVENLLRKEYFWHKYACETNSSVVIQVQSEKKLCKYLWCFSPHLSLPPQKNITTFWGLIIIKLTVPQYGKPFRAEILKAVFFFLIYMKRRCHYFRLVTHQSNVWICVHLFNGIYI